MALRHFRRCVYLILSYGIPAQNRRVTDPFLQLLTLSGELLFTLGECNDELRDCDEGRLTHVFVWVVHQLIYVRGHAGNERHKPLAGVGVTWRVNVSHTHTLLY